MLYGVYVMAVWLANDDLVTGWSSTIVIISLLCGMNMLMTGIIGLYVGRIHAEVKRRPLYVVGSKSASSAKLPPPNGPSFRGAVVHEVAREV